MNRKLNQFNSSIRGDKKIGPYTYKLSTSERMNKVIPTGAVIFDTELGITFFGNDTAFGGISQTAFGEPRVVTPAAASAFTAAGDYVTIASAADGVFTSGTHGYSTGDKIIAQATDATYGLVQDTVYTVALVGSATTFTLEDITPSDQTANVIMLSNDGNANYLTWAVGDAFRTGDGITAVEVDALPSGMAETEYYIIKDSDDYDSTSFRIATSYANAVAGTAVALRTAGSDDNTFVATDIYMDAGDDSLICDSAVACDIYLPDAAECFGRKLNCNHGTGAGAAIVTVKSAGGTIGTIASATGVALGASTDDFVTVVSDGTNWTLVGKQITAP